MSVPSRLRTPNPHLGAYYGIVASAVVSLDHRARHVRAARLGPAAARPNLMLVPLALYFFIAVGARTVRSRIISPRAGACRRSYNGFVLACDRRRRRGLSRLYRDGVLSRFRRHGHRARLTFGMLDRGHPVRAVSA